MIQSHLILIGYRRQSGATIHRVSDRALVSVVVPACNEEAGLERAIRSARDDDAAVEVIVADGGSRDGTLGIAAQCADRVVETQRNRAAQLNAGAAVARGDVLLFLHADSWLAPGAVAAARRALAEPHIRGGAFTLRIGAGANRLPIITWGTNLRARLLRLPFGDQAIFTGRDEFDRLRGFRPLPIMEDVDFVLRLRRLGRLALLDLPVHTSPRRWRKNGVLRTTFANTSALALFRLGVTPNQIRRYYYSLLSTG